MKQIVLKAQVNNKSDFDMILRLYATDVKDGERFDIGIPEYDWIAKFFTFSKTNCYVVSCIGGVKTNWYDDKGRIHVVFDNHKLLSGVLKVEFTFSVPDSTMPDGNRRTVEPQALEVQLVPGKTTIPSSFEAEIGIPWAFLHDTDAYNSILERVNAEFDKILGQHPAPAPEVKAKSEFRINPVIQRGLISIFSRPGMVYENKINCKLGASVFMRLPFNNCDLLERTFDLSKVFPDGLPEDFEVCDNTWRNASDSSYISYTYDREKNSLTVTRNNSSEYDGAILYIPDGRKYSMIGRDGRLVSFNDCNVALFRVRPEPPSKLELPTPEEWKKMHKPKKLKYWKFKCRSRKGYFDASAVSTKWLTNGNIKHKICGVVKVRRRVGRKLSDWAIFSFYRKGDGNVRYVRLN